MCEEEGTSDCIEQVLALPIKRLLAAEVDEYQKKALGSGVPIGGHEGVCSCPHPNPQMCETADTGQLTVLVSS